MLSSVWYPDHLSLSASERPSLGACLFGFRNWPGESNLGPTHPQHPTKYVKGFVLLQHQLLVTHRTDILLILFYSIPSLRFLR